MPKNTSFILGDHFDAFVSSQIEAGRYSNATDVIRSGLRLLEEREQELSKYMHERLASVPGLKVLGDYFPGKPFNYHFLRTGFDAQYKTEVEFGRLLYIFSGLTIFIAILGLIGLSSYTIQQRTKELGIRKVLGSSASGIAVLLSKDIFGPIFIANLIAWSVCWYVFSDWLAGFAFRTDMTVWPFFLSFLLISVVAASAIAYQVAKASVANPVKALKYE